jgi:exonuclease V gamma subunit
LIAQGAAICYLDKKWFYLFSRQKKSKHLPRAEFEAEWADRIRVLLKRLSEQLQLQRGTYRTQFHLDHHVNWLIVEGSWRQLYDDATYTIAELSQLMVEFYQLEDDVAQALCFCFETQVGGGAKKNGGIDSK